jgi:uncharacterized RDD family membrane protein YckC
MLIRRVIAYFFDLMFILSVFFIYAAIYGEPDGFLSYKLKGILPMVVVLGIFYLYHIIQELFWQKTIGKRIVKLKVVKINGAQLTLRDTLARHLFDAVELFCFPVLAFLVALSNRSHRRLGDFLAKTKVLDDF